MIGFYEIEAIQSLNGSLQITRSNNERDTRCVFRTMDPVQEWDEIIVENEFDVRLFAGILETPTISTEGGVEEFTADSRGYKKLFDRDLVQVAYEDEPGEDIVIDLVETFAPDFTTSGVETGAPVIEKVLYNYVLLSEGIQRVCDAIGWSFRISPYKDVSFSAKNFEPAPLALSSDASYYRNLKYSPDVSNFCNVVIVRGGTYLSEEVSYTEVADGEKTQFVLPEKPHDVRVFVNGVEKTVGIKFGQEPATAEFQVNFNEKYIENGTFATLADGDVLEVFFTYDVPIRVRLQNMASIAAMQTLFPGTNGEFTKVINDPEISTRSLAYDIAREWLGNHSNALISGSFETVEDIFSAGQILPIDQPRFTGEAVIQKITSRHVGGSVWRHAVSFSTVLFGFEEFLRDILAGRKVELIDGETLETSTEADDTVAIVDTVIVSVDQNRQTDTVGVEDDLYTDLNFPIEYVLGPYFPSSFVDTQRVFMLDGSLLG